MSGNEKKKSDKPVINQMKMKYLRKKMLYIPLYARVKWNTIEVV